MYDTKLDQISICLLLVTQGKKKKNLLVYKPMLYIRQHITEATDSILQLIDLLEDVHSVVQALWGTQ